MLKYFAFFLCSLFVVGLTAQPTNDDCFVPLELTTQLGRMCSDVGAYGNQGATFSVLVSDPDCWPQDMNTADVWFSFRASGSALTVTMNGQTNFMPGGTLRNPQFAIYEGVCGSLTLLNCISDATGSNSIELVQTDLVIGQRYYIRTAARAAGQGSFQLCLNSFNLVPPPESDCADAVLLCDKSSFNVERLAGTGSETNEILTLGLCLNEELASSWYKWVCDVSGTLTFTLTPNNPADDLDFILFELPGGLDDCENKSAIRCMASGENVNQPLGDWVRCTGPTGLEIGDPDVIELAGCAEPSNDNFVAEVNIVAGRAYVLMINNFSQSGQGFTMEFGGSGTFLGPEAQIDFVDGQDLDSIECDKTFTVVENINFPTGTIANIEWRFGADATPMLASGPGPHSVTYSSIGFKTITMSLTTDRGCIFNEFIEFDVLPCCVDIMGRDLVVDSVVDLICANIPSGQVAVTAVGGEPFYEYSLDGNDFQFNDVFNNLPAGEVEIFVRDRKGCIDSVMAEIIAPPPLVVDAGRDRTIGLGCEIDIAASVSPPGTPVIYTWTSSDTAFDNPGLPEFSTFPPGTTIYEIQVSNDVGCLATDSVTIFSDGLRPVFIPNAFSPNNDGINDFFTVFSNKASREIALLQVYDRWGAKVFESRNIPTNEVTMGWDGTAAGVVLNPGTYVYVAQVLFVDGVLNTFKGEINIIK